MQQLTIPTPGPTYGYAGSINSSSTVTSRFDSARSMSSVGQLGLMQKIDSVPRLSVSQFLSGPVRFAVPVKTRSEPVGVRTDCSSVRTLKSL